MATATVHTVRRRLQLLAALDTRLVHEGGCHLEVWEARLKRPPGWAVEVVAAEEAGETSAAMGTSASVATVISIIHLVRTEQAQRDDKRDRKRLLEIGSYLCADSSCEPCCHDGHCLEV